MSKPSSHKRLFDDTSAPKGSIDNGNATKKQARTAFSLRALNSTDGKRTNDEVHSSIDICPVAVAFIDTPQFQRLRVLKQLGATEFVYMNCNHTRFEHSLGVYWLAGRMVRRINERQPNLGCTKKDVLCVSLGKYCNVLYRTVFIILRCHMIQVSLPTGCVPNHFASITLSIIDCILKPQRASSMISGMALSPMSTMETL
jgi:hypothetical protein